jgi:hypothetical protein
LVAGPARRFATSENLEPSTDRPGWDVPPSFRTGTSRGLV